MNSLDSKSDNRIENRVVGNKTAVKWLLSVTGKKKLYIVFLTVVQGLYGATGVLYALILRKIVDAAVSHDSTGFWCGIALIILLVIGQLSLRAVVRGLTELSKATFENLFKGRLMNMLLSGDYQRIGAVHSGEWMNRMTNDTMVVAGNIVEIIPGLAEMIIKLLGALVMITILEPKFAVILIPGGALLILFTLFFRKNLKGLHKNVQEKDGSLRIYLQEHISSMLMIRSFAAEEQTRLGTEEKLQSHKAARMKKNRFSNVCNIGFGTAMNGLYLLGVGWCGYGILMGTISFGTLTAITQLISQIQAPFANITGYLPKFYTMIASAERLMDVERYAQDDEEVLSTEDIKTFYKDLDVIGLKDVSFAYLPVTESVVSGYGETDSKENMPNALEHFSLSIHKGEYVAFTGPSGCGKSTALKLFMCVYKPDSGSRYYRDINGDEEELTSAYRRLFGYVPQGNNLMNGTVREVVTFAAPEKAGNEKAGNEKAGNEKAGNEEKLWEALRIAGADGFVSELEQGVDTLLGERGTGLSEGQMQRLAIARAIFADSPILLLDEATSALDTDTEKLLLGNLRVLTDKTVIIVTHREAVLSICDRVVEFG